MNKLKRLLKRKTTWIILILFVFVYVNNSSFFAKRDDGTPLLLAHRGLSQTFSMKESMASGPAFSWGTKGQHHGTFAARIELQFTSQ